MKWACDWMIPKSGKKSRCSWCECPHYNNVHEKPPKKVKTDEILKACARCLLFSLLLHGNALVFSQSEGWYSWTSLKWKHLVQNQFYVKHNTCRRKFLLCHDTSILRRKTKGKQSNILFSLFIYSTLINIKSSKFPMIQRR